MIANETSGVAILDPDELLLWADMVDCLESPGAPLVETGRGRLHYWAAWVPGLPAKLSWRGVVIGEIQRGPGLQHCCIPPTIHPDTGKPYRWIADPLTTPLLTLPGIWLAYLRAEAHAHGR